MSELTREEMRDLERHWERVLASHGLSMNAGLHSSKKVSLVGGLNNLVGMEEEQYRKDLGAVPAKGAGPDR